MTDAPMTADLVRDKHDPEWIIGWIMGSPSGPWYGFQFEFPVRQFEEGEGVGLVDDNDGRQRFETAAEALGAVYESWEAQEAYMRRELGDDWKEWHEQVQRSEPAPPGEEPAWLPLVRERTKP